MTKYLVTPSALEFEADSPEHAARLAYLALASGPAAGQTVLVWNPPTTISGVSKTHTSTRWTLAFKPVDVTPKPGVVEATEAKVAVTAPHLVRPMTTEAPLTEAG